MSGLWGKRLVVTVSVALSLLPKPNSPFVVLPAATPWKKKSGTRSRHCCPKMRPAARPLTLSFSSFSEFESSQVTEKKRTVYQMALSKRAHDCQWMFPESVPLFSTRLRPVCPPPTRGLLHLVAVHFSVSLLRVPFSVSSSLLPLLFLPDKLDEILAAAQQTISTNEAAGTRGQGPKRDRGRSFYGNEVRIVTRAFPCWSLRVKTAPVCCEKHCNTRASNLEI